MTDENKALIGRRCRVGFEGKTHTGEVTDVVQTCKASAEVILYCVVLDNGKRLGKGKVELIED